MTREDLLQQVAEVQAELGRRTLLGFTAYTNALYSASWHHARLAAELDAVLDGRTKRLIVNMPPQHGKSELVSRRFPAYALGKRPDIPIIHASYNADLAKDMSRDVQQVIDSPGYRALFPETRLASTKDSEVRMAAQFDVVGKAGSYRAAGVGQGITGKSMILGVIDDPIKSRAEAESETYRRAVWNWYVSDFRTRAMGDQAAIVLVQTRWHSDDLAGRLLAQAAKNPLADQWRVVSFPAILEGAVKPGDPRQLGEALWPTRFSAKYLEATKVTSGIYDWSALYQQLPVPPGGAMAQRSWFKVGPFRANVRRRCRCWDLAATVPTHGRDPDWTVGTLIAEHFDGSYTVEHVVRTRVTAGAVDQLIKQTALTDGRSVLVREWLDPGAAGKSVVESHLRMLAGWDYAALPSSGEKSTRWRPFFVQAEGGNVWLQEAAWNREWLDEMSLVPYGTHDDQADSAAGAFQALTAHVDRGPDVGVVMPGNPQTVSGPAPLAWQEQHWRR